MKKTILLALALFGTPFFIFASSSAEKGNGIIINSVATDYFYGMKNQAPSLRTDLQTYPKTNITYAFPDMGFLTGVSPSSNPVNSSCPDSGKSPDMNHSFIYLAFPQLSDLAAPGISSILGPCVSGPEAVKYYKTIVGIPHVIPMISYDDSTSTLLNNLYLNQKSDLIRLADSIAETVTTDSNASGLAFDNEPGLVKITPDASLAFFGEIANQLLKKNQSLYLFDAPAIANILIQTYPNIVILNPLYDIDQTPSRAIANYLNVTSNPPVFFVLPASASDSFCDFSQTYTAPSQALDAKAQKTNISASNCQPIPSPQASGVIDLLFKNNDISLSQFTQTCTLTTPNLCTATTESAFQSTLTAITPSVTANPLYLGAILYTWRINGFNEIGCASRFASALVSSSASNQSTAPCVPRFPADIPSENWAAFQTKMGQAAH